MTPETLVHPPAAQPNVYLPAPTGTDSLYFWALGSALLGLCVASVLLWRVFRNSKSTLGFLCAWVISYAGVMVGASQGVIALTGGGDLERWKADAATAVGDHWDVSWDGTPTYSRGHLEGLARFNGRYGKCVATPDEAGALVVLCGGTPAPTRAQS